MEINQNSDATSATSYPENAVQAILEALATTLAAFYEKTEDFPLHAAGVAFQDSFGQARNRANLTQMEDEAFRQLRDYFHVVWKDFEKSLKPPEKN